MSGILIAVIVVLSIGLLIAAVFVTNYVMKSSKGNTRDRNFRREMIKLDSREAKALTAGDSFEVHVVNAEREALRQTYIAGKDI
ncbi:hypothetical protein SEA_PAULODIABOLI_281 [Microbacterium phage PauloDiaboli]|nr:hypothetical protein SEA_PAULODIABOLI_281 [Microbacterium phage PauloDiaboli]QWY84088.1 hypothetical protein SEA_A3WALLY_281 [Microbacterium phage A3Wally]